MRCRGFLLGGTAGRTTLAGEGLQHQDGNSHLNALAFPTVRAYDPCYAYELSVIILDGIRKMYFDGPGRLLLHHADERELRYAHSANGLDEGICHGIYRLSSDRWARNRRTCGSSAAEPSSARRCVPQHLLEQKFGVSSTVYSVTSYKNLYYDGHDCDRWNRLHPDSSPRRPYVSQALADASGPIVAASDYVAAVPRAISPWVGPDYTVLGTDGFGRSEAREDLRRFFEVDAENIALAALGAACPVRRYPKEKLHRGRVHTLGLDPEKLNQVRL